MNKKTTITIFPYNINIPQVIKDLQNLPPDYFVILGDLLSSQLPVRRPKIESGRGSSTKLVRSLSTNSRNILDEFSKAIQPFQPNIRFGNKKKTDKPKEIVNKGQLKRYSKDLVLNYVRINIQQNRSAKKEGKSTTKGQNERVDLRNYINSNYFGRFFRKLKVIGRGSSGIVLLCEHVLNQIKLGSYAVKICPTSENSEWFLKVLQEVKTLETITDHYNVIAYKHCWIENFQVSDFGPVTPCLFLLQEYANKGNLYDFAINANTPLDEETVWILFFDILAGLQHLHSCGIVHCDLKPQNILLKTEEERVSKLKALLSDFGTSKNIGQKYDRTGCTGTVEFTAPELLKDERQLPNFSTDIWSLGVILYFLSFQKLPFNEKKIPDTIKKIINFDDISKQCEIENSEANRRKEIIQLITILMDRDPSKRPTASNIFQLDCVKMKMLDNIILQNEIDNKNKKSNRFNTNEKILKSKHIGVQNQDGDDDNNVDNDDDDDKLTNEENKNFLNRDDDLDLNEKVNLNSFESTIVRLPSEYDLSSISQQKTNYDFRYEKSEHFNYLEKSIKNINFQNNQKKIIKINSEKDVGGENNIGDKNNDLGGNIKKDQPLMNEIQTEVQKNESEINSNNVDVNGNGSGNANDNARGNTDVDVIGNDNQTYQRQVLKKNFFGMTINSFINIFLLLFNIISISVSCHFNLSFFNLLWNSFLSILMMQIQSEFFHNNNYTNLLKFKIYLFISITKLVMAAFFNLLQAKNILNNVVCLKANPDFSIILILSLISFAFEFLLIIQTKYEKKIAFGKKNK
ncbi:serine/threonine-protein kinase iks1-related [Anaeramoeba flamelloides]|uniref:Serine/threonine-protein kinase iks1-related n=1 Tax=Anaeramoeba flamelloides TaxID=1746091 RepID=A0AAV7YLC7_9EUKA|nr:serine/threonine-protein kinase iks1-related [Anaeramoeba flamelloides]